jgi:hypothetical protein
MKIPAKNRTVRIEGQPVVVEVGSEMPWLSGLGACLVKVHDIRETAGTVEYGIGNEEPPVLAWVTGDRFYNEWPD